MSINLKSLVPYERAIQSPAYVFSIVDEQGAIILLRDNTPAYIITKAGAGTDIQNSVIYNAPKRSKLTLHEAMRLVLSEAEGEQMHASDLADEIFRRGLYIKKNGRKADYNQIRSRCGHYDMFDPQPGNIIRLKK